MERVEKREKIIKQSYSDACMLLYSYDSYVENTNGKSGKERENNKTELLCIPTLVFLADPAQFSHIL